VATILVVDDRAINRDFLSTLLRYHEHTVVEAVDGTDALELAMAHHPDLIITDLLMPGMDGYELVNELRASPDFADVPVIFYTAHYLTDEVRPFAKAAGVVRVLAKPTEPEELIDAVETALSTKGKPAPRPDPEALDREHVRALSAKLVEKIEELETAQDALQQSESRFRALAESSPVGIGSVSADGTVTYVNPALLEIAGLDQSSPNPSFTIDAIHPEDRDEFGRAAVAALAAKATFSRRTRIVRPDGAVRFVDVSVVPVQDPSPECAYVATVNDVTATVEADAQRQETNERVRTSERLESLGHLAAGVAHDFNNLLGVILNYAQFIATSVDDMSGRVDDPKLARIKDDVATITRAGERAAELTNQLLVFGRRESFETELVDLNEVVTEAERLLRRTIPSHVRVVTTLDRRVPPVMADRGRLSQVILNLAINARDAVSDSGAILISTGPVEVSAEMARGWPGAAAGLYSVLSVSDDGMGMDAKTLAHAFETFFTT
jgi:PAS domain S-box-containing protein